jgi:4-carboxymuconolactone decarboxylase
MRVTPIAPADLTAEQRPLYDDMRDGILKNFNGFTSMDRNGAMLGPFNPWVHSPSWGAPIWELVKSLSMSPEMPRPVREVAILVTGAKFRSAYEIYAHVIVAENRGLSDEKISTIVVGQRPTDLTREESIAYDVASALVGGHVLPELTYKQAVAAFGESGTAELIYLVGLYCLVSVTLNGFDVGVPEPDGALG